MSRKKLYINYYLSLPINALGVHFLRKLVKGDGKSKFRF